MKWTWEHKEWPHYLFEKDPFKPKEDLFAQKSGVLVGSVKHLKNTEKNTLQIEIISSEALNTSEIEGEFLNRDSLKSSIRKNLGLKTEPKKATPAEEGIANMSVDMYLNFADSLGHDTLYQWHEMLMQGRRDLLAVGAYRSHEDPMQIISGPAGKEKVHYIAPPSERVFSEMSQLIKWFNSTSKGSTNELPTLIRAGLAHLQFETIHPFEDGNGRLGRALIEKVISQGLGEATPLAISHIINRNKKTYYDELNRASKTLDATRWLTYFCELILQAQDYTISMVDFIIAKGKFFEEYRDQLNDRQTKVAKRVFTEGVEGFKGGLSAENYIAITKAPRATVTRDLQRLVEMGAFTKTGERKHTRYHLKTEF